MVKECILAGEPVELGNRLFFYPPTLRELLREHDFYSHMIFLLVQKEHFDIEDENLDIFDIISAICSREIAENKDYSFVKQLSVAFKFFTKEDLWFDDGDIGYKDQSLTSEQWKLLSETVSIYFGVSISDIKAALSKPVYANEKAREMAEKFRQNREEIERIKLKKQAKERNTYFAQMIKNVSDVCAKSNNINILQVWDLNYYQYVSQLQSLLKIETHDSSLRMMLAGAKVKNFKHWTEK